MPDSSTPAETPVEEQTQPEAVISDEATQEPEWLKLDPSKLPDEIRRLQKEDPKFLEVFNTEVGNTAAKQLKRKYEPEIQTLREQLNEERMQRRRLEILAMDEKSIEDKFAKDPDFAKEYAEVVHYTPKTGLDEETLVRNAYLAELQFAEDNGLSKDFLEKIETKAVSGGYTADHWTQAMQAIRNDITNEIIRTRTEAPPKINTNLTKPGADVAPAQRGAAVAFSFKTVREFKDLPVSKQTEILDSPGGMEYVESLMKKGS